ncbi:DUF6538 domain-containing protein [Trinickia mobilis]|uniref:DUF6538 domain-containing protein n=1 Tax=Trinickia mobilis TaxID=2816356 RepID=UPI0035ABACDD
MYPSAFHRCLYYFRRKIPFDLIAHYDGKKEVMRSLRTSDERLPDRPDIDCEAVPQE